MGEQVIVRQDSDFGTAIYARDWLRHTNYRTVREYQSSARER